MLLVTPLCCNRLGSPQEDFEHAYKRLVRGELIKCRTEARRGFSRYRNSSPQWALRFRILEARALLEQGKFPDALSLVESPLPGSEQPEFLVSTAAISVVARIRMHNLSEGEEALDHALDLCRASELPSCGDLFQAAGVVAGERSDSSSAEKLYTRSLLFARSHKDPFLESSSLLNLGYESLAQEHFDEAADRSKAAYQSAESIGASVIALVAQTNIGWAYYRLGDPEKALALSVEAEKAAVEVDDLFDRENLLTNIGYIQMDQLKLDQAAESFQRALELARGIAAKEDEYNALRVLARLALQQGGDPNKANDYAAQALNIAHESGNHVDELYPLLVQGQVAARQGDPAKARPIFEAVEQNKGCPVSLKWETQHALARLDEDQKQPEKAEREYRAALATFEAARSTVHHEDFQLSFLTNAARIYDDYVHFLVVRGQPDEALRWADYSRARTLSEGLGLLSKGASDHAAPPALNPREISRRARGTLLFYWLGEKRSYLWAITPQKTSLFPLPPAAEIESMVRRYRAALKAPGDVLASSDDGRALYRTLIDPAESLLAKDAKVFIIPDGSLNNLNFETLIVAGSKPHFWIEDADVTNASSLRVLAASFNRANTRETKRSGRLLLIGDSVAPSREYPELPRAGQQMANVAKHFPASQEQIYQRRQATPAAYLASDPEKFSYIHFVAHGTASRLSPLDSAIVLSKSAAETDSFKLYARDIVQNSSQHPLHADLVTISACYSAGERAYSGEGLVGLAWAFLRAGAHNVIAGLWDVTDASTEQLMDRFYDELEKGATPDAALRAAKLALLRGSQFHNPFYWAPFQLYTGS